MLSIFWDLVSLVTNISGGHMIVGSHVVDNDGYFVTKTKRAKKSCYERINDAWTKMLNDGQITQVYVYVCTSATFHIHLYFILNVFWSYLCIRRSKSNLKGIFEFPCCGQNLFLLIPMPIPIVQE